MECKSARFMVTYGVKFKDDAVRVPLMRALSVKARDGSPVDLKYLMDAHFDESTRFVTITTLSGYVMHACVSWCLSLFVSLSIT